MAERELTAQDDIREQGLRAKREHAERHGHEAPASEAASAEEAAEIGKRLGLGTYAADEDAAPADAKAVEGPAENKAQAAPRAERRER